VLDAVSPLPTSLSDWLADSSDAWRAVLPDYAGGSIANIPASILHSFGALQADNSTDLNPPLRDTILPAHLLAEARVVVLVVLDGLGVHSLERARSRDMIEFVDTADVRRTITSVFPSTTTAALTTLQTGSSPLQHGLAGYTLYLDDQQTTVNMITWKPVAGTRLARRLPDRANYLSVPTIYQRLASAGIESVLVSNKEFENSALTNLHAARVPYIGHRTPAEFAGLLLQESLKPGRRFVFGYWDGFDALAHTHGPDSAICLNEAHLLDRALGIGFLDPLSSAGTADIAVVVTADHGHAPIAQERVFSLRSPIQRYGTHRPIPTGDRRAAGLAFEQREAIGLLQDLVGDEGAVVSVRDAIDAGLYGPGTEDPGFADRIGQTLLLARRDGAFVFPQSSNVTAGGHGSLTAREMMVPLLGWRF
jgi:hypothetical protein